MASPACVPAIVDRVPRAQMQSLTVKAKLKYSEAGFTDNDDFGLQATGKCQKFFDPILQDLADDASKSWRPIGVE